MSTLFCSLIKFESIPCAATLDQSHIYFFHCNMGQSWDNQVREGACDEALFKVKFKSR